MKYRSPLSRALGLGSAKEGVAHWWAQRVTAAALVPLMLWFVVSLALNVGAGYEQARAWVADPFVAVLLVLLLGAGFYHAKLGLQVIIEDYVHVELTKICCIVLMNFAVVFLGAMSIFSVLKVAFGG